MTTNIADNIAIDVTTRYLDEESKPDQQRFIYTYTINIHNHSVFPVRLLRRYWKITNERQEVQEVKGTGVIGQQPLILPQQHYTYSSYSLLATPVGMMEGHYIMAAKGTDIFGVDNDSFEFTVSVPAFGLVQAHVLH